MANKAYQYRLYPNQEQAVLFQKTFGCCRKIYNLMLGDKKAHYQATGQTLQTTPAQYKNDYPYLREVDSLALANVQLQLESAYRNFFRGSGVGFPKFKSKKTSRKSYTTNNQKGTIALMDNAIKLPKVGLVRAVIHREPEADWKLKSATISQNASGQYVVSVLFEYEREDISYSLDTTNAIGLDYASDGLYVNSDGQIGSNHKFYRESHRKLAKEQRHLSRKVGAKKGQTKSKNYRKQQRKVAKIHQRIRNQRKDNLHKLSTEIANRYDVVCTEDLNMRALSNKGFGGGKATLDNGYGQFLTMLDYKLADRGKVLVKVDRWYPSSQICHGCGTRHSSLKDLSIRHWTCSTCQHAHDRDTNAAINILQEGLRMLAAA